MRYQMSQEVFCLGNHYAIKDEAGRDCYQVEGEIFSWGNRLSLRDMSGWEVLFIRQRVMEWGLTYEFEHQGALAAVVQKHLFTLWRCRFTVDVPGPYDLEAAGSFLEHEFSFTSHGVPVARVTKEWFTWGDHYGVEIADGQVDALILAAVVVIDLCCHDGRD